MPKLNLTIFRNYKLFEIFVLSIISGMPFSIILTCIITWLKESDVPLEVATTFIIAKIFYSFKFIWAPFLDHIRLPVLGNLGHRKSWLLLCSFLISIILLLFSIIEPKDNLSITYALSMMLGFLAATYDINLDAFRIETVSAELQGVGAANAVFGYRVGMAIAGAGSFYLADVSNSWTPAFVLLAGLFALGVIFILTVKEAKTQSVLPINNHSTTQDIVQSIAVNPFKDFLKREKALIILLAIILFKLGDAMLGVVSGPFYLELGYTKSQIASIAKLYGFIATLAGTYVGGMLVYKLGNLKSLIITGLAQSLTNMTFVWLAHQPPEFQSLFSAITIENFTGGMGGAALVAYLSFLCNKQYSATQYALLSSAAAFSNSTIAAFGGKFVTILGWDTYFTMTTVLGFPSIMLFIYLNNILKKPLR